MVSRLFLICCAVLAATSSVHALPVDLGTSLEQRTPSADGDQQSAPPIDEFAIDENLSASMAKIADMTPPPEKTPQATNGTIPKTNVKLTYYWLAYQPKTDTGDVELRSCNGKTLFGKASLKFAKKIRMEGSGHLANGKMLNLGSCNCADGTNTFNCFIDITKNKKAPFGYGVKNLPLVPFVSVANNDKEFAVGSWLYAADFDGIKLPNGKVHNGCLQKVDAIGRGGDKNHIDVFALTESVYKKTFSPRIKKSKIGVEWGSSKCDQDKVKGYGITPEMSFD